MSATARSPWRVAIVGSGEEAPDQLLANPRELADPSEGPAGRRSRASSTRSAGSSRSSSTAGPGTSSTATSGSRWRSAGASRRCPSCYVDLEPEEEALVLASLDPLAAMAGTDDEKLRALLADVTVDSEALAAMLAGCAPRTAGQDRPRRIPARHPTSRRPARRAVAARRPPPAVRRRHRPRGRRAPPGRGRRRRSWSPTRPTGSGSTHLARRRLQRARRVGGAVHAQPPEHRHLGRHHRRPGIEVVLLPHGAADEAVQDLRYRQDRHPGRRSPSEQVFGDTRVEIERIAAEDDTFIDEKEAALDAFSGQVFREELRQALMAARQDELMRLPWASVRGSRTRRCRGTCSRPARCTLAEWRLRAARVRRAVIRPAGTGGYGAMHGTDAAISPR